MRWHRPIKRFVQDQAGTASILWAFSLVAFLGLLAATYEVGRISTTHGELQSFVDNVALAAAGELDGQTDAITRATAAASALIADNATFNTGSRVLAGGSDYTLTFHAALPSSDTAATGTPTTNPRLAAYVQVAATPKTVRMGFLPSVNGLLGAAAGNDPQISASAVAGFTQAACDITPLMFCLPANWDTTLNIGDMILLRSGGNGAAWAPGNFGFIDLDSFQDVSGVCASHSGNRLACLIAAQRSVTRCISTRGITTEPGQKVGITNAAFNVRFDIYRATLNGKKNDPDFAPAPNVIKGIKKKGGGGNGCIQGKETLTGDTMALPRDTCMGTGTCGGNNRFGDGVWDRQGYLNVNHDLADGSNDNAGNDAHLPPLSGTNTIFANTRYGMYLREIAYGNTLPYSNPDANAILDPSLSETGRPQCSSQMSTDPARRVVVAAGVDCTATPISGRTSDVPVSRYVEVFLTEPVGEDGASPPGFDIYGEVVGFPDLPGGGTGGSGGIFRDIVQLYR